MHEFVQFDYLRPIFIVFVSILILFIFFQKSKFINGFSVISISIICSLISAISLWQIGIMADELNLAGDPVSFILFFSVIGLSALNILVYLFRNKDCCGNVFNHFN